MSATSQTHDDIQPFLRQMREMFVKVSGSLENDLRAVQEGWSQLEKAREVLIKELSDISKDEQVHNTPEAGSTASQKRLTSDSMNNVKKKVSIIQPTRNEVVDEKQVRCENAGGFPGNPQGAQSSHKRMENSDGCSENTQQQVEQMGSPSGECQSISEGSCCAKEDQRRHSALLYLNRRYSTPHARGRNLGKTYEEPTYSFPQLLCASNSAQHLERKKRLLGARYRDCASPSLGNKLSISPSTKKLSSSSSKTGNTFWINVWPCFGNYAARSSLSTRVVVYSRFCYLEDVLERAATLTKCRPAPRVLYEPHGEPVLSVSQLVPGGHYLIYPGGALYRREALPNALLQELVWSAKSRLAEHVAIT
uniref:Uncharacterized protein TCIL3000_11_15010 n=1 Tax=Trypanosoma congolense (strain IL3000) TaxID=1068625 RepID=G0V2W1_TRYCI|nr:unnamed protein product [Trypanosoma congolense IL3000]